MTYPLPDPAQIDIDPSWPAPLRAMWWLKKGDLAVGDAWEAAHMLCQENEADAAHNWVHALVHWIEGDDWNSGYWYRNAGKERLAGSIAAEWDAMARGLVAHYREQAK